MTTINPIYHLFISFIFIYAFINKLNIQHTHILTHNMQLNIKQNIYLNLYYKYNIYRLIFRFKSNGIFQKRFDQKFTIICFEWKMLESWSLQRNVWTLYISLLLQTASTVKFIPFKTKILFACGFYGEKKKATVFWIEFRSYGSVGSRYSVYKS